jgi:predicted chitinase
LSKIVNAINNAVDKQGGSEVLRVRAELNRVGITDPTEQANVLAQIEAESALKPRSENLNYSAKRLFEIWGPNQKKNTVRFKTLDDAKAASAKGEEHIASLIYDGRKDLGNTEAGDGYKFRGRGFIQLTGKDNYKRYGKRIGVDLVANPDLANDPEVAAKLAAEYFADKKKKGVDFKDIAAVTKAVGPADPNAVKTRTQLAQKYLTPGAPPGKKPEPPSQVAMAGVLGKPPPIPDFKPAADAITGFLGNAKEAVSSAFSDLPQISAPQMPQISAPDLKPAADAITGFLGNAGAAASSATASFFDNAGAAVSSVSDNLRTSMFDQEPLSMPQISAPDLKPAADAVSSFLSGLQAPSAERPEAIKPPIVDAPQSITPQPTRPPEPGDEPMIDRAPKIKLARKPKERPPTRFDAAKLSAVEAMADRSWLVNIRDAGVAQSDLVAREQNAPTDSLESLNRGFKSGIVQMGVDFDYARAGLESAMGNTDQMNIFLDRAKRNERRIEDIVGPTESLKEFFEEPTVDGFFDKVGLTLGQVAPSITVTVATAFATGGTSAVLFAAPQFAGKTVAVGTMKKMIKEAAVKKAKGLALDPAEEKLLAGSYQAIRAARGQAFKSGATAGAFATEYPQMTGASFREFSEAGVDLNDPNYGRASLAIGGGLAAIGVFGERLIVEGAFELATKKASRLSSNQNVFALAAKDIAALGLRGAATEGATEALQEGALVGQRFAVDDDYSAEDAKWRVAEAGFAGALAGGAIGGGSGVFTGTARALSVEPPVSTDRLRKERDVIRTRTLGGAFGPQRRPKYAGEYEAAKGATPQYAEDYKGLLHPSVEAEMRASDYTQDDKTRFEDVLNVLDSAYKDIDDGNIDVAREKLTGARALLDKTGAKKTAQYEQVQRLLRESFASLNQASKAQDPRTTAQKIMDKAKATTQAVRDKINEGRMDAEETGMSLDGPTQESEADYNAQIAHLGKTLSPKSGVWIPENSQFQFPDTLKDYEPAKADNVWVVKIPGQGVLLTRYKSDAVKLAMSAQENSGGFERMLARVLGYSAVKPDDADRAVAVQDAGGNIISEEATNEAGERAAVLNADKIAKAAGPGASVFVRDLKDALRFRRDRAEADQNDALKPAQTAPEQKEAPDQEVVDEGGMGDGPVVRNMSTNTGSDTGDLAAQEQALDLLSQLEPGETIVSGRLGPLAKAAFDLAQKTAPLQKPLLVLSTADANVSALIRALVSIGSMPEAMLTVAAALDYDPFFPTSEAFGGAFFPGTPDYNLIILNTTFYDDASIAAIGVHEYGHALFSQAYAGNKTRIATEFRASKTGQEFLAKFKETYEAEYGVAYNNNPDRIIEEWFADQLALYVLSPEKAPKGLTDILKELFTQLKAVFDGWRKTGHPLLVARTNLTDAFVEFIERAIPAGMFTAPINPDEVRKHFQKQVVDFNPDGPTAESMSTGVMPTTAQPATRNMSSDARSDALTTVDAEEATGGAVVKDYASAAGQNRELTPEQVKQMLDEAVPDEERRAELTRFEDALSDSAVKYIVKAYADDPDGYYFVDVIINESDEARIQIKRASTGKTASQISVDEQIADRVDALVKAVAKDARDRKDEKKAAVPGDSFATSIVVTSSKGKRTRPSIAQLIAIGMKINRIEGADALFLGEGMSPQQAVKAGLTRAVKELALLGYTFEIDPMPQQKAAADPGSISARAAPQRAAGRSLQLNRADLRLLQQPSSIPQLKDQVVYYDKNRRITYTYADVIATADAQVRQKDRNAGYLKAYTEGRRKRTEERLIRQWMNARRANTKRFTAGNLTGDQLALAQMTYGDLSAPDDVSPGTPLHDKLRDFVDAKLKAADKEFAQNLRDREIAFDPQDLEGVSDPDAEAEMLRSAMQAYMKENPGEEVVFENQGLAQQREEDAAKDNSQLPEETPVQSELVYEGAEKDLADRAELLAQMRPAAAAALRDNVDLVRESHIAILDAAARAGALPYMQAFAARRNNGNNTLTLRMAPIPVKDRPADYADKLRALYGALTPEAASRLRNKINFVTNKQLNSFYAIAANDPSRLEINTGEGGIINISRAKWFPGLTTPIMDLQRIIFELAKDPTAKILDGLSVRENPTPNDTLQLIKEVDRLKAFLREARAGLSFDMRAEQEMELNAAIERGEKDLRKKQDELRAARKLDKKGESKTRTTPKVQIPTRNASFKIHSAVPALVSRVLGVAHGIVSPNKPVDVFTASDFEAGFQELVDSGFIPADFVPVFQQQLASMRGADGDNVYGALVFRGRYIILLNDLRADGAVSDAVMAIAAAHEMGHILFIEEFGNIEMGAIPENVEKGLLDGYTQFVNEQRAAGAEVIPFEEWFSDQVGIYAYREASNEDQKRSDKESAVRREPQKPDAISAYFKSIAEKLKKLFNAVNKLFGGRLRQSQQFVDYFESVVFRRKKYAAPPTTLIGVAYRNMAQQRMVNGQPQQQLASKLYDDASNLLKDFMNDPIDTLKRTVYATDDYLRQMGPAGVELAQFFRGRSQSKEDTGFHSAKIFEQHRWFSKLADAIGIETDKLTTDEIDTILFEAEDNTIPTAQLSPKAQAVRKVFDDMYEQYITYTDANGAKKKWFAVKKAENYNPRQINTSNVAIEPTGFANWLAANGFESQSDANAIAAYLAQQAGSIMPAGAGPLDAPMMPHGKARSLNQIPTKALRDALMPDGTLAPGADPKYGWLVPPQMALTQYIHFTARKVEFERRGGKAKLEGLVAQLPKKKQADAVRALEANLGKLGDDIRHRPAARQFNSITQVTTAITTLTFAVFASLPDLAGVAMRSKDFSNFMDVMRQFKRTLTDKQNAELTRSVGVVTSQALDSIFMSPGEMDYTAPWAKKIMEKFFVFNGTDAYTRFARTFATGMGREFLVNTAFAPAFGPQQERWLSELGVTRDDITSWHASGQPLSDLTPGTRDHRIANAIARFAEEAVIRPDSSIKPGWASNPYYNVIWQLKTYFYAYGKIIIAGMAREFKNRIDIDGDIKGAVAQLSLAIGGILILTMIGLEAREWTKYLLRLFIPWKDSEDALQTDTMDLGQYSAEIVERSGLLGPFALATSAMEGLQREGWLGPVIATVPAVDFVDDSVFDGDWDRVLPVINNL